MIDYDEDWLFLLIFRYRGSVAQKAALFALPAAALAMLLCLLGDIADATNQEWLRTFREDIGVDTIRASQLWTASTAVLVLVLQMRTNRAISRFWEGTGLLHQMRGEWFDSVSCCVTFSHVAKSTLPDKVMDFRHTIVRLMSLCHAMALAEISQMDRHPVAIDFQGLENGTLQHLRLCRTKYGFNRVEVLLHMTQTLIVTALDSGVLKIPPPILSRVFQTLSRGFVNLLNAKKITDTRFPFPYAQLLSVLLFCHMIMTPVMISNLIENWVWAGIFTFVPLFGMFSLNYVAIELENPFGDDDNDLPMLEFQQEMNNCLLMLLEDHADLVAGTSNRCVRDFKSLQRTMHKKHENDSELRRLSSETRLFQSKEEVVDEFELQVEDEQADESKAKGADAAAGGAAAGTSPAQVARRLENLETMLKKSVDAVEKTFEQWMLKAEEHAKALRMNTDAITQLVMVHV
jgi:predicted membrane chloride channel (bestrophin family)